MRRRFPRIRGLGFILWHGRHELIHILLGLMWAWFMRERLGELNWRWVGVAVFGSLLPDADHLVYFLIYGRRDAYSKRIRQLFRSREWRMLTVTLETNHKNNVHLATHNLAVIGFLVLLVIVSYFFEWQTALVLVGAMVTHYLFDVVDDLLVLGSLNPNWKRLGRGKKIVKAQSQGE